MKLFIQCALFLLLLPLLACEDDISPASPPLEAKLGEAFVIEEPGSVRLTGFENVEFNVDFVRFEEWIARGLYSRRTRIHVKLFNEQKEAFIIEAGYNRDSGICYGHDGTVCDEVAFSVGEEQFLLQVNEVYWGEQQQNGSGVEYYLVDSAAFVIQRL